MTDVHKQKVRFRLLKLLFLYHVDLDVVKQTLDCLLPMPLLFGHIALRLFMTISKLLYRVCHGFRLTKQDDYSWVGFDNF